MTHDTAKQVNENQCQQCMPLGGVIVFNGIENAMVLVHGSQGCSTYMRLVNVEHYNEPVDIASSSLNEKQTIYGGEANLKLAIDNVVRVYQPRVLGVVTTCLAETMGEDLDRIIGDYRHERGETGVDIIPVPTPSYSGSQTEGFWAATRAIIARYARPTEAHRRINVIIPHISPADIREIRRLLDLMGCEYTLIPDYSLTGPSRWRKIPEDPARRDPDWGYCGNARRPLHDPVWRDLPGRTLARTLAERAVRGTAVQPPATGRS
jgi:nitrogenase molybdenum-iron protein NifN